MWNISEALLLGFSKNSYTYLCKKVGLLVEKDKNSMSIIVKKANYPLAVHFSAATPTSHTHSGLLTDSFRAHCSSAWVRLYSTATSPLPWGRWIRGHRLEPDSLGSNSSCVILGKLFIPSVPQWPHLLHGDNTCIYLIGECVVICLYLRIVPET